MSYYHEDPYETQRLRDENRYLLEQVRTLSAELSGRHRAEWRMVKTPRSLVLSCDPSDAPTSVIDDVSHRPPCKTAASRMLLADEVIASARLDVLSYTVDECMRKIEDHARGLSPLDHLWRITVERDYFA